MTEENFKVITKEHQSLADAMKHFSEIREAQRRRRDESAVLLGRLGVPIDESGDRDLLSSLKVELIEDYRARKSKLEEVKEPEPETPRRKPKI